MPARLTPALARGPVLARSLEVFRKAGLFDPLRPQVGIASILLAKRWGPFAGSVIISARRDPGAVAIADECGELTFGQLDRRSNALARAWLPAGLGAGTVIGMMCRDHRGLVESMLAAQKIGARLLLLNTGFGGRQLADVAAREQVAALVHDQEFGELLAGVPESVPRYLGWVDDAATTAGVPTLDELIERNDGGPLPAPRQPGGFILLTSGTTGTPKGAPRRITSPFVAAEFLDRIPLRTGEATVLGAPIFHGTGLSQFVLSFALGSTVVLRRRFDPEETLRAIERYRCTAVVLVPTMLQRILALGTETIAGYDTSSLRVLFCSGSALAPEVGNEATRIFGDVIHNLYGSTEVAVAAVATPQDWRQAPGTVGRSPVGCRVRLYDRDGHRVTAAHRQGRVFAGSGLAFAGYTSGDRKDEIDGLLATGDIGHLDERGLLFIDGRDDDMIVSGGENVYPAEIENLLLAHERVTDAAVVGVPDDEFGQRLKAFVVPRTGTTGDPDQLKDYVKANLARYKVPREFVFVDELPRNATGKLLRGMLR